jgi:hypothetical protein
MTFTSNTWIGGRKTDLSVVVEETNKLIIQYNQKREVSISLF